MARWIVCALLLLARAAAASPYADALERLQARRVELARRLATSPDVGTRNAVLEEGRTAVLDLFDQQLFPAWKGTAWAFNGHTLIPREGEIACGYFVTTLLRDAGFEFPRVKMSQVASETLIKSFVASDRIQRFWKQPIGDVEKAIRKQGDGLYVVGLDFHVGFLRAVRGRIEFCHSSYLSPYQVVCESSGTALALESRYRVLGRLFDDAMMIAWLETTPIPVWPGTWRR